MRKQTGARTDDDDDDDAAHWNCAGTALCALHHRQQTRRERFE